MKNYITVAFLKEDIEMSTAQIKMGFFIVRERGCFIRMIHSPKLSEK